MKMLKKSLDRLYRGFVRINQISSQPIGDALMPAGACPTWSESKASMLYRAFVRDAMACDSSGALCGYVGLFLSKSCPKSEKNGSKLQPDAGSTGSFSLCDCGQGER